jgi:KaiC/GvpD/RAD55 family RecA-like ATPase
MLIRLIDFLKLRGITAFFTNLTSGGEAIEKTDVHVSSLVDAWLLIRDIESGSMRSRAMYVLKSRGMPHSNELRTFLLTNTGFELLESTIASRDIRSETSGEARPRRIHGTKHPARGRGDIAETASPEDIEDVR